MDITPLTQAPTRVSVAWCSLSLFLFLGSLECLGVVVVVVVLLLHFMFDRSWCLSSSSPQRSFGGPRELSRQFHECTSFLIWMLSSLFEVGREWNQDVVVVCFRGWVSVMLIFTQSSSISFKTLFPLGPGVISTINQPVIWLEVLLSVQHPKTQRARKS